jgi:hypothetical protein
MVNPGAGYMQSIMGKKTVFSSEHAAALLARGGGSTGQSPAGIA